MLELSPEHPEARLRMAQVAAHDGEWVKCRALLKDLPDKLKGDNAVTCAALLEKARGEMLKAAEAQGLRTKMMTNPKNGNENRG